MKWLVVYRYLYLFVSIVNFCSESACLQKYKDYRKVFFHIPGHLLPNYLSYGKKSEKYARYHGNIIKKPRFDCLKCTGMKLSIK